MDTKVYTQDGSTKDTLTLPSELFATPFNHNLVHEVIVAMQANARAGTAHTKDRGDVSGGGKKPWRQKGTGRARHGSRRSPMWTGGGVTFGPRSEKDFSKKINKKVRLKALTAVLSRKYTDGELVLVDAINLDAPATATAKTVLQNVATAAERSDLATKRRNAALVVLPERNDAIEKSFQNFGNIAVVQAKDVNPLELLTYKYVLFVQPTAVLEVLTKRVGVTTPVKA